MKLIVSFFLIFGYVALQGQGHIENGKVLDGIVCNHEISQTYAVYSPSYYTPDKAWPVIYIFEPAARGVLPVRLFKAAAERWGYIIVSSNNSKNGNWQLVFDAADAMFVDTAEKFNIDQSRIYTSGFSGGARSAIAVARLTGQVAGIIGCGAGSPNPKEYLLNTSNKVPYVGIVGDVDMNYMEMKSQEKSFNQMGIENLRLTWPSGHQWPPSHMVDKAIQWLEYQTNDTLSVERKSIIEQNFINYRDSLYNAEHQREAIRIAKSIDRDMGIAPGPEITQFEQSKEYIKGSKALAKAEKKELSYQATYYVQSSTIADTRLAEIDSLSPILWWKNEIDRWQKKKDSKDVNVQKMSLRLLNQIWASSAEQSFAYESRQDYELALRLNEIWLHGQSTSVWALWSRAKLHALNGDKKEAMKYLGLAHKNGMTKVESLTKQPAFNILKEEPAYRKLLSELSQ
jgi:hypothetical protein